MKKILIVDDELQVIKFLSNVLKQEGYQVDTASNVPQALLRADANKPDLIISDIAMKGMDGFQFVEKLKENSETKDIPFIFISGRKDPVDQLKGLRMGAQEYFTKPFDVKALAATVKKVLEKEEKQGRMMERVDFSGNLAKMGLEDIIQIAEINQKTGELVFTSPKDDQTMGSLFFSAGRLIHAASNRLEGEEAFYDLAYENEGYFKFLSLDHKIPETISAQTMGLMFEATRMKDEAQTLYKSVDNIDAPLEIQSNNIPPALADAIGTKWIQKIFKMIGQGKTIREMIHSGQMSRLRAEVVISGLLAAKIIRIKSKILKLPPKKESQADASPLPKEQPLRPFDGDAKKISDMPAKTGKSKRRFLFLFIPLIFIVLASGSTLFLFSKQKQGKEGKVVVTEQEFAMRKLSPNAYTIDAKGKVKNVGEVNLKNITVTGQCESCADGLAPGRWTVVKESERARSAEEQTVIERLAAGEEANFSFTDVAIMYNTVPEKPKEMPSQLKVIVLSFETAN